MQLFKNFKALFQRRKADSDLNDELRFHVEKEVEQNIARGMSPDEARRCALIAFGGVQQTRERVCEAGWRHLPETLFQDLRFGLRMLVKAPGFALAAVLTLALGIGANAYVFSSADALLLRPLAFPKLDRLMTVFFSYPNGGLGRLISPADFLDWKRQNKSFENLAGYTDGISFNLTGGDPAEKISAARVSANFFSTLSASPVLGRAFAPEEEQPGHEHVVVLSYGLWMRRYGSDPSIVGRELALNGQPFKVIGVVGKKVNFPAVDLWVPISWTDEFAAERKVSTLQAVGRLKPGVSQDAAEAELKGIEQQLAAAYPATDKDQSVVIRPLRLVVNGTLTLPLTKVLALAAGLVLLLACANVAGLLIARGVAREKEMAVRGALGARRWRLVRQLFAENVLLAALGCAVAVLLAKWAAAAQKASFSPIFLRLVYGLDHMSVDVRAFLFMLAVTVFCVIAFGLAPAFGGTRVDLNQSLREGSTNSGSRSRHILRSAMASVQVAMALALLAAALLMGRGFHEIETVAQGMAPDDVLTFSLELPRARYTDARQQSALYDQVLEKVETMPGVTSAAALTSTPFSDNGVSWIRFRTDKQTSLTPNQIPGGIIQSVSPGYFGAMRIPLLRGRDFTHQDKTDGQPVVIVNERFARIFWRGENPLGKTLRVESGNISSAWLTVVGVAQDVLYDWTNQVPEFTVYRPYAQAPRSSSQFAVRVAGNPLSLAPAVRKAVSGIDPELPAADMQTLSQDITDGVTPLKWIGGFIEALGVLALVLAVVGVYGVMANSVSERTREIGIRIALGANRGRVLALLLRKTMLLTVAGITLGWPLAIALARMLANISYGVRQTDTFALAVCALVLFAVAMLACVIPARRASRVDPLAALRRE